MNFLAHYHFARGAESPWFVVGTAIPDLVPLADRQARVHLTPRFPQALHLEAKATPSAALRAGMAHHLLLDAHWHGGPWFRWASRYLLERLTGSGLKRVPRLRLFFVAHVASELLVDFALLRRDPDLAEAYYRAFDSVDLTLAAEETQKALSRPAPAFEQRLRRFSEVQYLRQYESLWGVQEGLERLLGRARQPELTREAREDLGAVMTTAARQLEKRLGDLETELAPYTLR